MNISKAYDFKNTEDRIYKWWEKSGFFQPDNDPNEPDFDPTKEPFVISIPPPNITGSLHIGHAMFVSMEDLMIRYHRMKGEPTLWVPGSDHASIATQLLVERALKEEGITREEIGREKFIERTWQWKKKYGAIITNQIRRLGASCDWSRERFTMDEGLSCAVREAFVRLYEKGLIYRGPRLINWSPNLKTAVSDLEVEHSQEPGTLYYFKYMLSGNDKFLPVATTRPETILGDSAVAVHPEDERYRKFIGKTVTVPILGREIPVIADEYVDRKFGTGALKVTPAHDPNDYEIAQRHNLPLINIFNRDASLNENSGSYESLTREECRLKIWEDMKAQNLVIKEEDYMLNVPRSQRGGEIIEPMISEQWFVSIQPLAEKAIKAVRDGSIRIIPEHFEKVYFNWMENIQDWCISRQLWWGHRIPVWYCDDCGKMTVQREDPASCEFCDSKNIHQDEDVLDTWFSSGLWPFSTLGWPDETADFKYFYPTSVMETGYDILFFWVARMIMMGLEFTGEIPFHTIYLHGLVRDGNGQKMSKTKGNVIDPLVVMDEFGTDALRITLLVGSTPGNDTNLSVSKVEANRNFANKLWNAGRFVLSALEKIPDQAEGNPDWTIADEYIHARMRQTIRDVNRLFESYQYGEAGRQIYEFFWSEFADWYIEASKQQIKAGGDRSFYTGWTLVRVLDKCLRMLHPFTPFVTEELWGHLKTSVVEKSPDLDPENGWGPALMKAKWPEPKKVETWESEALEGFKIGVLDPTSAFRTLKTDLGLPLKKKVDGAIVTSSEQAKEAFGKSLTYIKNLAGINELEILDSVSDDSELSNQPSESIPTSGSMVFIRSEEDPTSMEDLTERLKKDVKETISQINRLQKLLASDFSKKAPAAVVQKEREKLAAYEETAKKIQAQLDSLNK